MKNVNFAANFQKTQAHDYEAFFKTLSDSPSLILAQKELKAMLKEVEKKQHEVISLENQRYSDDFVLAPETYVLRYDSSRNYNHYEFDAITGELLDTEPDNYVTIDLPTKNGTFSYVKGYNFSLGAVLVKKVKYAINGNNTAIKFISSNEILVPMLESVETTNISDNYMITSSSYEFPTKALTRINATFFINSFYGIDKDFNISLSELKFAYNKNKSTEIILKTASPEIMPVLLDYTIEKSIPIHKIVGCSKEAWELAGNEKVQPQFIELKRFLENINYKFKKTDVDWVEFLKYTQAKAQDLRFYNVNFGNNLAVTLISKYMGEGFYDFKDFPKYYKFGKFCNYVIDETINQGINSIDNFVGFMSDYLKMCVDIGITPTLYSSYLKQTHDICARNHKIAITEEMDFQFIEKYKDFTPLINSDKTYSVIAPTSCRDLQQEGDALNHCVASYITRVINNECLIYFLRYTHTLDESLITVEVRNNAVVQARGLHNRDITLAEEVALREFATRNKLKYRV